MVTCILFVAREDKMFFFRNRFKSILSIGLFSEGYALGRKPPKKEQAKSNQRDAY